MSSENLYRWVDAGPGGPWVDTDDMRRELIEDGILVPVESETLRGPWRERSFTREWKFVALNMESSTAHKPTELSWRIPGDHKSGLWMLTACNRFVMQSDGSSWHPGTGALSNIKPYLIEYLDDSTMRPCKRCWGAGSDEQ